MYIINCGGEKGRAVVFGEVDAMPRPDEIITIRNARMILYWDKACGGLLGLAAKGPAGDTRITHPVPSVMDYCRQVIEVTPEAAAAINNWEAYDGN